jgi:aspartate 1-decarboxylase
MQVKILRGKIHRATVTGADIDYEGSITLDSVLMAGANILPNQEVEVWDVTNGERLQTYALAAPPHSGVVCLNGAAARRVKVGDLVIVAAYGWVHDQEAVQYQPSIVRVDERNRIVGSLRSMVI